MKSSQSDIKTASLWQIFTYFQSLMFEMCVLLWFYSTSLFPSCSSVKKSFMNKQFIEKYIILPLYLQVFFVYENKRVVVARWCPLLKTLVLAGCCLLVEQCYHYLMKKIDHPPLKKYNIKLRSKNITKRKINNSAMPVPCRVFHNRLERRRGR